MEDLADHIWIAQWPQGHKPSFTYGRPTFEMHVGKSGMTWLIPAITIIPAQGDHIYRTAYKDVTKVGRGFAGATLVLPLLNGNDFTLRGGWHGNSKDLYEDTGIDTFNLHKTYGAVGLHRGKGGSDLVGILYKDSTPKIGRLDRISHIAQDIANELNQDVFVSYLSYGGGLSGVTKPEIRR